MKCHDVINDLMEIPGYLVITDHSSIKLNSSSSNTTTGVSFTVLPVWILWTNVHLQQDSLGERLKALATLPQVPVTEITAQLAGGGWAGEDALVL